MIDTNTYRLDMNSTELETLRNIILGEGHINQTSLESLNKKIKTIKIIKRSNAKVLATAKASDTKTKQAKEKIENGINILRLENVKFTFSSIAKSSGVSFNTVKKYVTKKRLKSLNDLTIKRSLK